ncbi:MAG: MlaD family protein [bacterium]|nr:MlaD family protein [bacterium]
MFQFLKKLAGLKTEMNVGLLILAGTGLLMIASIQVTRYDPDLSGTYSLKVTFENVSGLVTGTAVKVAGITVGEVSSIELVDGEAEVTVSIMDKYRLRTNSRAMIKSIGILGDKYIEVSLGSNNQQALQSGDRIQLVEPGADLDSLIEDLSYILSDVRSVTKALNASLGGEKGEAQLKRVLSNVEGLTANLDQVLDKTNQKIGPILSSLESFSSDLAGITADNRDEVHHLLANLRDFSESLNRFVDNNESDLNRTLENLDYFMAKLSEDGPEITGDLKGILKENRDNLRQTMSEIKEASANLNSAMDSVDQIAYKIDSGQGTLGRLVNDEETINSINTALDGVNEFINPMNKLRIDVGFQTEQMITRGTYKSYVDLNIRPVRDHYYQLRLVNHPEGKITSTRTETTDTSTDVVISDLTEYQTADKYLITAMIVQRYFDTELSFGLNEGTAGFGLEQYFGRGDQYSFRFDAFEFNRTGDLPTHLRAGGAWRFAQNFYVVGGMDDLLNTQSNTSGQAFKSPYLGMGIRFTEDYLKSLLGTAATAISTQ